MSDESPTNAAEFTVSEISGALKRLVEDSFGNVRVRGEISGYRGPHSSGHAYFSLKDDKSRLEAVVWRGSMSKLKFLPEEGMEVIATGKLTTFPGSSKYQIVIEQIEPAGAGALMALLEERKRKLSAEGLFAEGAKQLLPFMPRVIGVVTSPTGAVIRDIIHRITDRFPLHVIVWPVRVQGETCGPEVAAAVNGFNALDPALGIARPDVIIVARGGGSLEDLWGFNDEIVVRAVAASDIPVISAVGHETDWTLIDYAADVRAPTPTGAAEIAVPVKAELEATLASLAARLSGGQSRLFERKRQAVASSARGLPSPGHVARPAPPPVRRGRDAAGTRIEIGRGCQARAVHQWRLGAAAAGIVDADDGAAGAEALRRLATGRRGLSTVCCFGVGSGLTVLAGQVSPTALSAKAGIGRQKIAGLTARADTALKTRLHRGGDRLVAVWRLAEGISHKRVLERGFALVRDENGAMVRGKAAVSAGQHLSLQFADGAVQVLESSGSPAPAKAKPKPAPPTQGALF